LALRAEDGVVAPHHQFSVGVMGLFIRLVLLGGVSLRGAGRVLRMLGEMWGWDCRTPHWTTGRLWLLRLGLYQLRVAKAVGADWVWIVDHSVQIGTQKCLVILGLRLCDLPPAGQCLTHRDVELIGLVPMESSTRQTVFEQLQSAAKVRGVPKVIVDDHGADLHGGVKLFQAEHEQTVEIYDAKHKAACVLKRRLEGDEQWKRYESLVGKARCSLQQTELACLVPVQARPKSRFMNLSPLLDWGSKMLAVLHNPPPELSGEPTRGRMAEKLSWVKEFEPHLRQWGQWQRLAEVTVQRVGHWGLYDVAADDLERELERAVPRASRHPSSQSLAEELVSFVAGESAKVPAGGRFPGSTEVLESLFGRFKALEKQQARGGFTGLLLGLGAMVGQAIHRTAGDLGQFLNEMLDQSLTRDVIEWCHHNLGTTLCAQRRRVFASALSAQHNADEDTG
jgi:hypothetical protein